MKRYNGTVVVSKAGNQERQSGVYISILLNKNKLRCFVYIADRAERTSWWKEGKTIFGIFTTINYKKGDSTDIYGLICVLIVRRICVCNRNVNVEAT